MSSRIPVAYIDLRTFAHGTEDVSRVLEALHHTLPEELVGTVNIEKTNLTGHHGNPIVLLEAKIKDKKTVVSVFQKLSSSIGVMDKETLGREIEQHLEKGTLYLRLDKQTAYLNEFRLCSIDPIHFRVHFKTHSVEEIIDACRRIGLLS